MSLCVGLFMLCLLRITKYMHLPQNKEEISMSQSEVTRLREQIAREHEAACWALTGLASGSLQHRFINRRMQRIDAHHKRLAGLIGEQASIQFVDQIFEKSLPSRRGKEILR